MSKSKFIIFCICTLTALHTLAADDIDLSIGSYYFFAALDKKCTDKNAKRTEALENYKQQYISSSKLLLDVIPPSIAFNITNEIEALKKYGPAEEKLIHFNSFFAKYTEMEIQELCSSAADGIAELMQIKQLMINSHNQIKNTYDKATIENKAVNVKSQEKIMKREAYVPIEELEKEGAPFGFLSIQHLYAIMKRCETIDPDSHNVILRKEAFEKLLDSAKTFNGVWRTFYNVDGKLNEKHFSSAREMFNSPEFPFDMRRYHESVSYMLPEAIKNDCAEFVSLVTLKAQK